MINRKLINNYTSKLRDIKVEYSTYYGLYTTKHGVKVTFSMPYFPSRKNIMNSFHVDNSIGDGEIGYEIIIGCDLMVQLGPKAEFSH